MALESKIINFDDNSREELLSGVALLSDAVSVTMGPLGMNVVIESPGEHPVVTKDGVTVAKSINISDRFKNLGVNIVKEAAARTADTAGDGTTTATVLAHAIFSEGIKMMSAGYSSRDIVRGVKSCASEIIENISKMSKNVESEKEIMQVATISANGEEEIGSLITTAMNRLGIDGVITVEPAKGFKSDLVVVEGMQINRGYLSPYFVNNSEKMTVEFENPRILLCNQKISSIHDISHLLESSLQNSTPILIICDDVDGDAMQGLVVNVSRGVLSACAIRAPGFGNSRVGMLEDLSMMLGSDTVSNNDESLKNVTLMELGTCARVIVTRTSTIFIDCPATKESIDKRSASIKDVLKNPLLSDDEISVLRIRLARLAGGVGVVRVGGATEGELIERRDRVDDALNATQAAIEEGIVAGGGVCLLNAIASVSVDGYPENEKAGARVMRHACYAPISTIIKNAGGSPDLVISKIEELDSPDIGYNVLKEEFCNMIDAGVIDPSKVTRCAVENAVSAACTLLSVGCAMISDKIE